MPIGTGGLDQTMRLKAALQDEVSPSLDRIEGKTRSTKAALKEFAQAAEAHGQTAGKAASQMAEFSVDSLQKLESALQKTQQTWTQSATKTSSQSKKVSTAIDDSLYSGKTEKRMRDLGKDLKKLEGSMEGLANKQRASSAKATRARASSRDLIHKKLIPAFDELHGTLDQYPETLKGINAAEQERLNILEKGGDILNRVKDRVLDVKDAANQIRLGASDALAMATTGTVGAIGTKIEGRKQDLARLGGSSQWDQTVGILESGSVAANTSMGNVAHIQDAIMQLRSTSTDNMDELTAEMYNIEKATGLAGDQVTGLYDELGRVGGIKGEDVSHMMDMIQTAAQNSTASQEEMLVALQNSASAMLAFSGESKTAYAASSLAAAAQAKNMGLGADYAGNMREQLLNDIGSFTQMQGLLGRQGVDLEALLAGPNSQENLMKELQTLVNSDPMLSSLDMNKTYDRHMLQSFSGGMISPDQLMKLQKGEISTGAGTNVTAESLQASKGTVEGQAQLMRTTVAEQVEKMSSHAEVTLSGMANQVISDTGAMLGEIEKFTSTGRDKFLRMDDESGGKFSKYGGRAIELAGVNTLLKGFSGGFSTLFGGGGGSGGGGFGGGGGGGGGGSTLLKVGLGLIGGKFLTDSLKKGSDTGTAGIQGLIASNMAREGGGLQPSALQGLNMRSPMPGSKELDDVDAHTRMVGLHASQGGGVADSTASAADKVQGAFKGLKRLIFGPTVHESVQDMRTGAMSAMPTFEGQRGREGQQIFDSSLSLGSNLIRGSKAAYGAGMEGIESLGTKYGEEGLSGFLTDPTSLQETLWNRAKKMPMFLGKPAQLLERGAEAYGASDFGKMAQSGMSGLSGLGGAAEGIWGATKKIPGLGAPQRMLEGLAESFGQSKGNVLEGLSRYGQDESKKAWATITEQSAAAWEAVKEGGDDTWSLWKKMPLLNMGPKIIEGIGEFIGENIAEAEGFLNKVGETGSILDTVLGKDAPVPELTARTLSQVLPPDVKNVHQMVQQRQQTEEKKDAALEELVLALQEGNKTAAEQQSAMVDHLKTLSDDVKEDILESTSTFASQQTSGALGHHQR